MLKWDWHDKIICNSMMHIYDISHFVNFRAPFGKFLKQTYIYVRENDNNNYNNNNKWYNNKQWGRAHIHADDDESILKFRMQFVYCMLCFIIIVIILMLWLLQLAWKGGFSKYIVWKLCIYVYIHVV